MAEPKHGDQRNYRREKSGEMVEFFLPNGQKFEAFSGVEQSASDRYCDHCETWVTAKGIIGGLICPICATPWDAKMRNLTEETPWQE